MRNLLLSVIFLGIAGYLGTILYEQLASKGNGFGGNPNYSYPDRVEITNLQGHVIEITLLGRNKSHIEFKREDGQKFVYPMTSLDANTREMVLKYPNVGIKNVSDYLSDGRLELSDVYVQQLESEIQKINETILKLNRKGASTRSLTEQRTIERKIEALEAKIVEIEDKIANRQ